MGIRSRDYLDCNLFSSVNLKNGVFNAICHTGYSKEARQVTENIVTLAREYFGRETAMWFTPEACAEASFQTFNRETSTIEDDGNKSVDDRDMLDAFGHKITEVARCRATKNGKVLADSDLFDGHISSNDNEYSQ